MDFNREINRKNTASMKWDYCKKVFGSDDVLPMWIADMDFLSAPPVIESLEERVRHGIYGYTAKPKELYEAIANWQLNKKSWKIDTKWILTSPGVVSAISTAIISLTNTGDGIIIQEPVYGPFRKAIERNGRKAVVNNLIKNSDQYSIDFNDLEKKAKTSKLLIFCNPHNPVGRVWNKKELETVNKICTDNGVIVISDEIHGDIVYSGSRHIPLASISSGAERNTITCISPGKTFNLAGLKAAAMIIPDDNMKRIIHSNLERIGIRSINLFGITAMEAAYSCCDNWIKGLVAYLEDNRNYVAEFIRSRIPIIDFYLPQGTYLLWLDFSKLKMDSTELKTFIIKEARLGLDDGIKFGIGSERYMRLNFACPRTLLQEAMRRLEKAVNTIL